MSEGREFPELTAEQRGLLEELERQAKSFNQKLNLYSETSTRVFWQRHIEHSLALATRSFPPGADVVDWGTGGGMPGLPLAVLFPEVTFYLVDSVSKKVRAVQAMARRLGLKNVRPWHGRAERWGGRASYSVSRATAPLDTLWQWHERVYVPPPPAKASSWQPGLICLKGGNLTDEIAKLKQSFPRLNVHLTPLEQLLGDSPLGEKVIVEVYREEGGGVA